MLRLRTLFGLGLSLSLALSMGCGVGRHIQKGINCYQLDDLPCAMSQWLELEQQQPEMNPKGQMRYLVYRGLTHYQLGERDNALAYLTRGEQAYLQGDPRWLPDDAVLQLRQALGVLRQQGSGDQASPPSHLPPDPAPR